MPTLAVGMCFARSSQQHMPTASVGMAPTTAPTSCCWGPLETWCNRRRIIPRGRALPQPAGLRAGPARTPYDEEFLLARSCTTWARPSTGATTWRPVWRRWRRRQSAHRMVDRASRRGAVPARRHAGRAIRRRLEAAEDFDELMLLADCDRHGRAVGLETPDVRDALDYVRDLAEACEDFELVPRVRALS